MNIYLLISQFWRKTEGKGVSTTEAALYSYLLYLANMNRWKMPFTCSTSSLAERLHTSKQSVVKARAALQAKGMINFEPGKGNNEYPRYSILQSTADDAVESVAAPVSESMPEPVTVNAPMSEEVSNNESDELSGKLSDRLSGKLSDGLSDKLSDRLSVSNELSNELSDELSGKLSGRLSDGLSGRLSLNNINIKYKDKDRESESLSHARKEKSIDELEKAFAEDTAWHSHVVTAVGSTAVGTARDVVAYIHRFFDSERAKGVAAREENDCRSHFFHWLKIQVNTRRASAYGSDRPAGYGASGYGADRLADLRRGVDAAPRPMSPPGRPF